MVSRYMQTVPGNAERRLKAALLAACRVPGPSFPTENLGSPPQHPPWVVSQILQQCFTGDAIIVYHSVQGVVVEL